MECPTCDSVCETNEIYCHQCGEKIRKECPVCNEHHPINARFCTKTGKRICDLDKTKKK